MEITLDYPSGLVIITELLQNGVWKVRARRSSVTTEAERETE